MKYSHKYPMKQLKYITCCAAILVMSLAYGCNSKPLAVKSPISSPPIARQIDESPDSQPATSATKTPMKDSVTAVIAKNSDIFPKDTKLNGINLKNKIVTLDFSAEFNKLALTGEGKESEVQQKLRTALAKFPSVHKMCVTVDGKSFQSQATDWSTPFPVRDAELNSGESGENSMEMTSADASKLKKSGQSGEGSPR